MRVAERSEEIEEIIHKDGSRQYLLWVVVGIALILAIIPLQISVFNYTEKMLEANNPCRVSFFAGSIT